MTCGGVGRVTPLQAAYEAVPLLSNIHRNAPRLIEGRHAGDVRLIGCRARVDVDKSLTVRVQHLVALQASARRAKVVGAGVVMSWGLGPPVEIFPDCVLGATVSLGQKGIIDLNRKQTQGRLTNETASSLCDSRYRGGCSWWLLAPSTGGGRTAGTAAEIAASIKSCTILRQCQSLGLGVPRAGAFLWLSRQS
jgi:hypothetical protein